MAFPAESTEVMGGLCSGTTFILSEYKNTAKKLSPDKPNQNNPNPNKVAITEI